jgi:hypothetical protein
MINVGYFFLAVNKEERKKERIMKLLDISFWQV